MKPYIVTRNAIVQLLPATPSGENAFGFWKIACPVVGVGEGKEEES